MSEGPPNFVDLCLAGKARPVDIDGNVGQCDDMPENGVELAVHLGLTAEECALWIMEPLVLPALIAARQARKPVCRSA